MSLARRLAAIFRHQINANGGPIWLVPIIFRSGIEVDSVGWISEWAQVRPTLAKKGFEIDRFADPELIQVPGQFRVHVKRGSGNV